MIWDEREEFLYKLFAVIGCFVLGVILGEVVKYFI